MVLDFSSVSRGHKENASTGHIDRQYVSKEKMGLIMEKVLVPSREPTRWECKLHIVRYYDTKGTSHPSVPGKVPPL